MQINQHCFTRKSDFKLMSRACNQVIFCLQATNFSKGIYPFDFSLEVAYELLEQGLRVYFKIRYLDQAGIYFNFGWHPGFVATWGRQSESWISIRKVFGERSFLKNVYLDFDQGSLIPTSKVKLRQVTF